MYLLKQIQSPIQGSHLKSAGVLASTKRWSCLHLLQKDLNTLFRFLYPLHSQSPSLPSSFSFSLSKVRRVARLLLFSLKVLRGFDPELIGSASSDDPRSQIGSASYISHQILNKGSEVSDYSSSAARH